MQALQIERKVERNEINKSSKLANASRYLQLLFFILNPSKIPADSDKYILDLAPSPAIKHQGKSTPWRNLKPGRDRVREKEKGGHLFGYLAACAKTGRSSEEKRGE